MLQICPEDFAALEVFPELPFCLIEGKTEL
jgi:hypothetical protein